MALYGYSKRKPPEKVVLEINVPKLNVPKRGISVTFSAVFCLAGIFMLTSVLWPMIQWSFVYLPTQPAERFVSPVPKFASPVLANSVPDLSSEYADWVPRSQKSAPVGVTYTLTIPKLKIDKAVVDYGGTDLKKNLLGWADSPLPGKPGNNIIFGHSALPTFYDVKNYHTIFTYLPSLKVNDVMYIDYDGVQYKYVVFEMQTLDPEDFSILEQRFDDSYLTLVTCVPPGTYWKRLMIRARITKF